ncbi:hypothetical protein PF002_g15184 [Phytophthora fragariae]|uniref:BED-type domain-containing protein n=1 Tax=Phytophthora fragariae TaxID=53985 RepID=A0A6A3YQB4_9STRA|nr:hypothetical protein PF002_g15184 [Phytophthora fragariae]
MATNREICALFFKTKDQGVFLCQLCGASRKQQLGSGYSNLMSHLISTYPGFEETYHSSPVSSKTVKRDMQRCSTKVGSLIKTEMGELFGLMWDGWSHASVHYVAIYAVCNVGGKRPERLLSLSPLDGGSQDAEMYIEMFNSLALSSIRRRITVDPDRGLGLGSNRFTPRQRHNSEIILTHFTTLNNKDISMVAFLVAGNCSTNNWIATLLDLPLVSFVTATTRRS